MIRNGMVVNEFCEQCVYQSINNSEHKQKVYKLNQDSDRGQHAQNNKRSGVKNSLAV